MTDTQKFVLAVFEAKGAVPGATPEEKLKQDYFEAGLVDSIGIVDLVAELEKKFGVRFTDKNFQDPRFAIIGGIAELVAEHQAAAPKA